MSFSLEFEGSEMENIMNETIINPIFDTNQEPVKKGNTILCQVIENGNAKIMYIEDSVFEPSTNNDLPTGCIMESNNSITETSTTVIENKLEWSEKDTKLLLDLYNEGLSQVGPLKKFKNKKTLWQHISKELESQLKVSRSASQCESRYKTVLRRKITVTKVNKTSGETREKIEYENEIEKIKSQDDSLEPEILMSGEILQVNKKRPLTSQSSKKISPKRTRPDLLTFLKDIHKEKEVNKERRHKEKLELMRELFRNDNIPESH